MELRKPSKFIEYLSSYKGKVLFNFFYGFGASIAILGTLFKILHLDGANIMLAVGLGTEVLMFALSAFEPPFRNYHWEEVFPILKTRNPEDMPNFYGPEPMQPMQPMQPMAQNPVQTPVQPLKSQTAVEIQQPAAVQPTAQPAAAQSAGTYEGFSVPQIKLSQEESQSIENSLKEYAEQMNTLNLHLKGLNTIYEIQLKDISSQIHTIDCINQSLLNIKAMYEGSSNDNERFVKETEAMASNLSSLNEIYARMLQAMMKSNI